MKNQTKKLKCRLLQFLFGAFRVNGFMFVLINFLSQKEWWFTIWAKHLIEIGLIILILIHI